MPAYGHAQAHNTNLYVQREQHALTELDKVAAKVTAADIAVPDTAATAAAAAAAAASQSIGSDPSPAADQHESAAGPDDGPLQLADEEEVAAIKDRRQRHAEQDATTNQSENGGAAARMVAVDAAADANASTAGAQGAVKATGQSPSSHRIDGPPVHTDSHKKSGGSAGASTNGTGTAGSAQTSGNDAGSRQEHTSSAANAGDAMPEQEAQRTSTRVAVVEPPARPERAAGAGSSGQLEADSQLADCMPMLLRCPVAESDAVLLSSAAEVCEAAHAHGSLAAFHAELQDASADARRLLHSAKSTWTDFQRQQLVPRLFRSAEMAAHVRHLLGMPQSEAHKEALAVQHKCLLKPSELIDEAAVLALDRCQNIVWGKLHQAVDELNMNTAAKAKKQQDDKANGSADEGKHSFDKAGTGAAASAVATGAQAVSTAAETLTTADDLVQQTAGGEAPQRDKLLHEVKVADLPAMQRHKAQGASVKIAWARLVRGPATWATWDTWAGLCDAAHVATGTPAQPYSYDARSASATLRSEPRAAWQELTPDGGKGTVLRPSNDRLRNRASTDTEKLAEDPDAPYGHIGGSSFDEYRTRKAATMDIFRLTQRVGQRHKLRKEHLKLQQRALLQAEAAAFRRQCAQQRAQALDALHLRASCRKKELDKALRPPKSKAKVDTSPLEGRGPSRSQKEQGTDTSKSSKEERPSSNNTSKSGASAEGGDGNESEEKETRLDTVLSELHETSALCRQRCGKWPAASQPTVIWCLLSGLS